MLFFNSGMIYQLEFICASCSQFCLVIKLHSTQYTYFLQLHKRIISIEWNSRNGEGIEGHGKSADENQITYDLLVIRLKVVSLRQNLFYQCVPIYIGLGTLIRANKYRGSQDQLATDCQGLIQKCQLKDVADFGRCKIW